MDPTRGSSQGNRQPAIRSTYPGQSLQSSRSPQRQQPVSAPSRNWLAHLPLWVVMGLGGVVLVASEEPEAARATSTRVAIGEISRAVGSDSATNPRANAVGDFTRSGLASHARVGVISAPFTLTDLGAVPSSSLISAYPYDLAMHEQTVVSDAPLDLLAVRSPVPVMAMAGLPALRHSFEQRMQSVRVAPDATDTQDESKPVKSEPILAQAVASQHAHADVAGMRPGALKPVALKLALPGLTGAGHSSVASKLPLAPSAVERNASPAAGSAAPIRVVSIREQQRRIVDFLHRYYRRPKAAIASYARYAFQSAKRNGVDPLLVMSIMSIESSMNPKARSHKGAKGLMQVLVAAHKKRFKQFGGTKMAYQPRVSIEVGTRIIAGMIVRTGSVHGALKHYVGAANFRTDGGYGEKVLGMRERIWAAATGQPIPAKTNHKVAVQRANLVQGRLTPVVKTARR